MFGPREAWLTFTWSRLANRAPSGPWVDQAPSATLVYTDFLEALTRVAALASAPTDAWMEAVGATDALRFRVATHPTKSGACGGLGASPHPTPPPCLFASACL